ncbi:MAG: hypothetical protein JNM17_15375 [Archangium sp.]|nr:hypothetical protein [Archangium sp.]
MRRVVMVVLFGFLLAPFGLFAWAEYDRHSRRAAPDAWREFAREAKGDELEDLALDYTRFHSERFVQFNTALAQCDEEAFATAERLEPLIRRNVHGGEEFWEALSRSLSRCPARTFRFVRGTSVVLAVICEWSDPSARRPVTALLDSGMDDEVQKCLAAMDARDARPRVWQPPMVRP